MLKTINILDSLPLDAYVKTVGLTDDFQIEVSPDIGEMLSSLAAEAGKTVTEVLSMALDLLHCLTEGEKEKMKAFFIDEDGESVHRIVGI